MNENKFRPANLMLATAGLCIAAFMQVLDTTIANVALPTISAHLNVTSEQGVWVITSFAICNAIGLPLTGWLSRRYGEVRFFVSAVLLFVTASFLCGLSQTIEQLIVFRALQGLAAAPLYPVAQALLLAIFPNSKRGMAFAILSVVITIAPISGPILGGWLTERFSWPWIFFINIPLGILSALWVWRQLGKKPETKVKEPVDYIGLGFLVIGVSLLQIVLDKGNGLGWFASPFILVSSVTSFLCILAFLGWELTSKHPIVNLRLFAHRNFTIGTIAFVFSFAAFFAINLIMPLWLQNQMGYTATRAGLAIAPIGVLSLVLAPLVGHYAHKLDMRMVASFSFIVMGTSCLMRTHFTLETSFIEIALIQFWMGLGTALFFVSLNAISLSDLPASKVADGSGLITFLRTLASSFAASLSIWLWGKRAALYHTQLSEDTTSLTSIDQLSPQAYMLSTVDYFTLMGYLFFALVFIIWFAKPPFTENPL